MITSNSILFTIICVFGLQAILLSILLFLKKPRTLAQLFLSLLLLFHAVNAINIVVVNVLKDYDLMYVFRYIQLELLYGIGPALYFYTLSITKKDFTFKRKYWIHFLPLLLEFIFYRTSFYRDGSNGLYETPLPTITYIYLMQQWIGVISLITYGVISLKILYNYEKKLKNYFSKIDDKTFDWLKIPILIYGSFYIFWNVLTEIDRFFFDRTLREYYFLPTFVIISIVTCWIGFKGYVRKESFFVNNKDFDSKKDNKSNENDKDLEFVKKLDNLMKEKRPYLNPDLNLSKLAELLEMKSKILSQKINQNYDRNFYDLINYYRVEAFKNYVKSNSSEKFSLLGIAYECGFNSKSTFNLVFKNNTQLTPSQYLKKIKKES